MDVISPAFHLIGYVLLICILFIADWMRLLPKDLIRDARYSAGIVLALTAAIQLLIRYALIKGFISSHDEIILIKHLGNAYVIDIGILIGTSFIPLLLIIRRIGSYQPASVAMVGIILLYFLWNWRWALSGDSTAVPLISTVYQPLIDLGLMSVLSGCVLALVRLWKEDA